MLKFSSNTLDGDKKFPGKFALGAIGTDSLTTTSDMGSTSQSSLSTDKRYVAPEAIKNIQKSPLSLLLQGKPKESLNVLFRSIEKDFGTGTQEDLDKYWDIQRRLRDKKKVNPEELAFVHERNEEMSERTMNLVMGFMGGLESKVANELKIEIKSLRSFLNSSPAKKLSKFVNKNGELPEVLGSTGGGTRIGSEAKFGKRGDTLVTELGFADSEEARTAYEVYTQGKAKLNDLERQLVDLTPAKAAKPTPPETLKFDSGEALAPKLEAPKPKTVIDLTANRAFPEAKVSDTGNAYITSDSKRIKLPEVIKNFINDASQTGVIPAERRLVANKYLKNYGLELDASGRLKNLNAPTKNVASNELSAKPLEIPRQDLGKTIPQRPTDLIIPSQEVSSFETILSPKPFSVKQKTNILDYLRTPEKVLQKIGLGEDAKLIRAADEAYKSHLKKDFTYLQDLRNKVPSKESSQKIFQALDGSPVELTPAEQEVAETIKTYLKDWADKLKLPEDNRISNYITHVFEQDFIQKEFDPDLAKLIADRVPGSVYNPFLENRLGKLGYKEDVWAALDAYVKRATRKFNFDPALEQLSSHSGLLDLESYNYVKKYAAQINMRPTEIDSLIDNAIKSSPIGYKLGQRPVANLTSKWRAMIFRGGLGLNFSSALRNLTQGVNTYATLGEKYTTLGYVDLARNGTDELYRVGALEDNLVTDRVMTIGKKVLDRLDKGLMYMFDSVEKINRGAAYYGAKRKALDSGLGLDKAVEYAKSVVRKTQFTFGKVDTPVALGSDITKTLAQFQTFNIKQLEFLGGMIKDKDFAGIIRFTAGSFLMLATIGKLFGMRPEDLIPTVRLGGSPVGKMAGGLMDQLSPNAGTRAMGLSKIKSTGRLVIPAGSQINKSIQGISQAIQNGSSTLRGALFGKDYSATSKKAPTKKAPAGTLKFNSSGL